MKALKQVRVLGFGRLALLHDDIQADAIYFIL